LADYAVAPDALRSRLDPESANIAEAVRSALVVGDTAAAMRICGSLAFYWTTQPPGSTLGLFEDVAEACTGNEPAADLAWGLAGLGYLRRFHHGDDSGRQPLQTAQRLFGQLDDQFMLTVATFWLAMVDNDAEQFQAAIELAGATGNFYIEAMAGGMLARTLLWDAVDSPVGLDARDRDTVERALVAADKLNVRYDLRLTRFETFQVRSEIMLLDGATDDDPQLDQLLTEGEELAGFGGPTHVQSVWCRRLHARRHRRPDSTDRRMLLELLDNVAIGELLLPTAVAIAANHLRWVGNRDDGDRLIDGVAPHYAAAGRHAHLSRFSVPDLGLMVHFDDLVQRARSAKPRLLTADELRGLADHAFELVSASRQ
jgi:hypothetical protein